MYPILVLYFFLYVKLLIMFNLYFQHNKIHQTKNLNVLTHGKKLNRKKKPIIFKQNVFSPRRNLICLIILIFFYGILLYVSTPTLKIFEWGVLLAWVLFLTRPQQKALSLFINIHHVTVYLCVVYCCICKTSKTNIGSNTYIYQNNNEKNFVWPFILRSYILKIIFYIAWRDSCILK